MYSIMIFGLILICLSSLFFVCFVLFFAIKNNVLVDIFVGTGDNLCTWRMAHGMSLLKGS